MCSGYDVLLQRETPAELQPEAHLENSPQLLEISQSWWQCLVFGAPEQLFVDCALVL